MAIVFLIIASALEVVPPYLLGSIIDILTAGEMSPAILSKYILIFVGIIIGGYALNFVWQFRLFEGAINLEKKYYVGILCSIFFTYDTNVL